MLVLCVPLFVSLFGLGVVLSAGVVLSLISTILILGLAPYVLYLRFHPKGRIRATKYLSGRRRKLCCQVTCVSMWTLAWMLIQMTSAVINWVQFSGRSTYFLAISIPCLDLLMEKKNLKKNFVYERGKTKERKYTLERLQVEDRKTRFQLEPLSLYYLSLSFFFLLFFLSL